MRLFCAAAYTLGFGQDVREGPRCSRGVFFERAFQSEFSAYQFTSTISLRWFPWDSRVEQPDLLLGLGEHETQVATVDLRNPIALCPSWLPYGYIAVLQRRTVYRVLYPRLPRLECETSCGTDMEKQRL